jgi:hypothetical protein
MLTSAGVAARTRALSVVVPHGNRAPSPGAKGVRKLAKQAQRDGASERPFYEHFLPGAFWHGAGRACLRSAAPWHPFRTASRVCRVRLVERLNRA